MRLVISLALVVNVFAIELLYARVNEGHSLEYFNVKSLSAEQADRCGPLALEVCSALLGVHVSDGDISEFLHIADSDEGATIPELAAGAGRLGLSTLFVRWSETPVVSNRTPAILPVMTPAGPHYIVLAAKSPTDSAGDFLVIDFPRSHWMTQSELESRYGWEGYALYCAKDAHSLTWIWLLVHRQQLVIGVLLVTTVVVVIKRQVRRKPLFSALFAGDRVPPACLLLTFGALCVSGCTEPQSSSVDPPASIVLEPSELSLTSSTGTCSDGVCVVELSILNRSESAATIEALKTSCGCTIVDQPPERVIPPQGHSDFRLRANLPSHGSIDVTVNAIVSQGAVKHYPSSRIQLRGEPLPIPRMVHYPHVLDVERVGTGPAVATFYCRTVEPRDEPYWIKGIVSESPDTSIGVERVDAYESAEDDSGNVVRTYVYKVSVSAEHLSLHADTKRLSEKSLCA